MDRRIRQIAALLTFMLVAVAAMSGYVQGLRAESIAAFEPQSRIDPNQQARNQFRIFQECRWERGAILSADGQVLAESVPVPAAEKRKCRFERHYPLRDLAPHVVGQWSLHFGKSGLERAYNEDLVGDTPPPSTFADLFTERDRVGHTLVSTIDTRLQRAALEALAGRRGGIVAMSPKSGAVLAAASLPSYDPNGVASNNRLEALRARCDLGQGVQLDDQGDVVRADDGTPLPCRNPDTPAVSRALQAKRAPGSSFKVVTAAAALQSGKYQPSTSVPVEGSYLPPGSRNPIGNFGGGACGGTLIHNLTVSCNTAFARIAVDVGADRLRSMAGAMGLSQGVEADSFVDCESVPITDIGGTFTGCLPSKLESRNADGDVFRREKLETPDYLARAGFGQWVLQVSPFGMATVAATVANLGYVPRPRFADRVLDPTGVVLREVRTGIGASAFSTDTAKELRTMMRSVVTSGTAAGAFRGFPVPVAGKTGTAQQPSCDAGERAVYGKNCGQLPHAWFIAFAPVEDPQVAIAVLIERGGGNNEEATGGRVAAPVARRVLETFFQLYPAAPSP